MSFVTDTIRRTAEEYRADGNEEKAAQLEALADEHDEKYTPFAEGEPE